MSQSSGFDPKAFNAIQMCAAFRFLFFFSSAIFSFLLIGTVGTGLSLEQQLAGGASRAGRGWHGVWCAGASELCPVAPRDTAGIGSHVSGVLCGFGSWLSARQGQEGWDCP